MVSLFPIWILMFTKVWCYLRVIWNYFSTFILETCCLETYFSKTETEKIHFICSKKTEVLKKNLKQSNQTCFKCLCSKNAEKQGKKNNIKQPLIHVAVFSTCFFPIESNFNPTFSFFFSFLRNGWNVKGWLRPHSILEKPKPSYSTKPN